MAHWPILVVNVVVVKIADGYSGSNKIKIWKFEGRHGKSKLMGLDTIFLLFQVRLASLEYSKL